MIQRESVYGWEVLSKNVCGVESDSWVINEDAIRFLSRGKFAVDTFVFCKSVEGRETIFQGSVILN